MSVLGGTSPSAIAGQYGSIVAPYEAMTANQAAQLAGQLGDFGVTAPPQLQQGVTAVNNLLPAAQTTIAALKAGNVNGVIADATPLIAAGLAFAGVGTVATAAVVGGLVAFTEIASALGLFQPAPPQSCTNVVGTVCFTRTRPWGTADPNWLTIERFTSEADAGGDGWTHTTGSDTKLMWGECAFTWWDDVGAELYALGDRSIAATNWLTNNNAGVAAATFTPTPGPASGNPGAIAQWAQLGPVGKDFCRSFDLAWIKMSEMYLNGYGAPDPGSFVSSFVAAWNTLHSASQTFNFTGTGFTFVDYVLAGQAATSIGGANSISQGYPPTGPVNIGAAIAPSVSTPMTAKKKAAIAIGVVGGVTVVTAGAATAAWYAGYPVAALFGRAVGAVGGLFGAEEFGAAEASRSGRKRMKVQSLLFPLDEFTSTQARAWARRHGYRDSPVDVTSAYTRIRQRPPGKFSTFRTVPLGDSGVKAVMAR